MSKKKNPTQAETRVSQTSPEAVLRGALQQHPEIRKGLEFLLSQNICTPVLVATLSSKSPATERKSAYEAWERICGTNTLNNRLGDNREKMDVRNQRIVWLTAETSEIVRGVLTDAPEATKKKPTEKVALAKKGGVREKKEVDGFEWGNAFFPEYPHEHNLSLIHI